MKTINFAGRNILPIGLGTWHMGDSPQKRAEEIAALRKGIQLGATAIDTAEMYGEGNSELLVGQAIEPYRREDLYLISKVYPWNASEKQLPISLANSLERLGTDYLDLYLLHWTGDVPLAETVTALEKAKSEGKILNWGVSNFDVADMEELWGLPNGQNCATNEVLYNLGSRGIDYDLLPWLREKQVPLIAYSPIAQGDSLGNRFTEEPVLVEIAQAHQCSVFQLLLAWSIRDERTLSIPQSGNAQHVVENVAAAQLTLTADEWEAIEKRYPKPASKQPLAVL